MTEDLAQNLPRIMRVCDVCQHFGFSRRTLYYLIEHGRFPRGKKVGRVRYWTAATIIKLTRTED